MMIRLKQSEKIVSQLEAVNTLADRELENNSSVVYLKIPHAEKCKALG